MAVRVAILLLLASFAAVAAASASAGEPAARAAFVGPFTGVGTGHLDRYHHMDDLESGADHFYSDSKDVYNGRFTYSFRIENDGTVVGTGQGAYQSATWHLSGQNDDQGMFDCDIPVSAGPFSVDVSGHAEDGRIALRFELRDAREVNADYDCGAGYTGYATNSTYLADSLLFVQPAGGIVVDQANPAIAPISRLEQTGDQRDSRVNLHEWTITIAPPPGPPVDPTGGTGQGPGNADDPSDPGTAVCTIEGTSGPDRLAGTQGNDVICGLGGNDRINGKGGDDLVYGSSGKDRIKGAGGQDALYGNDGRDRLSARDGRRDLVHGGRGRDRARVDRGTDTVRKVEVT